MGGEGRKEERNIADGIIYSICNIFTWFSFEQLLGLSYMLKDSFVKQVKLDACVCLV